jgi:hypothetical protein
VDTTIRNIDEDAYQRLRTWAAHHGLGIGEALSRLVLEHAHLPTQRRRKVSIWSLKPWDWGPGTEHTSEEIDKIVYGEMQE